MNIIRFTFVCLLVFSFSCAHRVARPDAPPALYTVNGEIVWKGPTPIDYPLATTAYRGACGKRQAYKNLTLKKTRLWHKRILDVAVWLEPVWDQMTPEEIAFLRSSYVSKKPEYVEIVEQKCLFRPNTIVVPVGTRISIVNEDRKDHWFVVKGEHRPRQQYVQYYGATPPIFSFETPEVHNVPMGAPAELVADKVDKWHIISGFHKWMNAWVIITDKMWFDEMVDSRGIFSIDNVPTGVYKVHAWQPLLGESVSIIRIPEDLRGLVAVTYNEYPLRADEIPSTVITTFGEVREQKNVWKEIDDD